MLRPTSPKPPKGITRSFLSVCPGSRVSAKGDKTDGCCAGKDCGCCRGPKDLVGRGGRCPDGALKPPGLNCPPRPLKRLPAVPWGRGGFCCGRVAFCCGLGAFCWGRGVSMSGRLLLAAAGAGAGILLTCSITLSNDELGTFNCLGAGLRCRGLDPKLFPRNGGFDGPILGRNGVSILFCGLMRDEKIEGKADRVRRIQNIFYCPDC